MEQNRLVGDEAGDFLLREAYNEEQFVPSHPFDSPTYKHTITELETTPFTVTDIFQLGFQRTNPDRVLYFHSTKPRLYLQQRGFINFAIRDRLDIQTEIFYYDNDSVMSKHIIYSSNKPNSEDIKKVIDSYV